MKTVNHTQSEQIFKMLQKEDYQPQKEVVTSSDLKETLNYLKALRQYFLLGKQTALSLKDQVNSIFLAPFLNERAVNLDFPAMYDARNQGFQGFFGYLSEIICEVFSAQDAEILLKDLPNVISYFHEKIVGKDRLLKFSAQIKELSNTIRLFEDQVADPASFLNKCELLEDRLMKGEKLLFGFSGASVFQLLDLQLKERRALNTIFLNRLNKTINGIQEILELQEEGVNPSHSYLDFADELIAFNKIKELSISAVSSKLSEDRRKRLHSCLETLKNTRQTYKQTSAIVFTSKKMAETWELPTTLNNATLEISDEFSFAKARTYYEQEIQAFIQTIAALRLAELEMDQHYDEELHHSYFEGFDFSFLTDDDLRYFHTLVIIEDSRQIWQQPNDYEDLLSKGALIHILAVNPMDDYQKDVKKGEENEPHLDLAAQAIFRRQTSIYQGGMDDPKWLKSAFKKGLEANNPVLWNIILPVLGQKETVRDFIAIKSAIESRYFPRIVFEPLSDYAAGIPVNLESNHFYEEIFSIVNQKIKNQKEEQTLQLQLTPADFLAMNIESIGKLEIIPSHYADDHLVLIDTYLTMTRDQLVGKIPFVWVVNEEEVIKQAAVPISWVKRCRARIDSWTFLQALDGSHSQKVKEHVEMERSEWEEKKKSELEALEAQLTQAFEKSRLNDIQNAIYRILNGLIDGDISSINDIAPAISSTLVPEKVQTASSESPAEPPVVQGDKKEEKNIEEVIISSEVWVETDECTSCNDCIDALPTVFKYDSNKQAIVHNSKGGTFAKIVAAAEKCPARCIHPGTPQNPKEPGLDKLVKRAEKFN